jgi:hypothetical protein
MPVDFILSYLAVEVYEFCASPFHNYSRCYTIEIKKMLIFSALLRLFCQFTLRGVGSLVALNFGVGSAESLCYNGHTPAKLQFTQVHYGHTV